MRREDYERTYGRRVLHPPAPVSSSHTSSRRSKRSSKRKMKCLISIGLILPALAAVIGVAAWAVSADVVMNTSGNRMNKADIGGNQLLQGMSDDRNSRRSIFNSNQDLLRIQENDLSDYQKIPDTTTTRRSTTTSTTTTTTTQRPTTASTTTSTSTTTTAATPSSADVSALLSKLISASNAASGGNGPRFVVVAPLPDHAELVPNDQDVSATTIARVDQQAASSWKPTRNENKFDQDLLQSESVVSYQHHQAPQNRGRNITNRVGFQSSRNRESGKRHSPQEQQQTNFFLDLSKNTPRRQFSSQPAQPSMELPTYEFESFVAPPQETLLGSPSSHVPVPSLPQIPGFAGPFAANSMGPPKHNQGFMAPQRDPLIGAASNPVFSDSSFQAAQMFEQPNPFGFGLKPIQQHLDIGASAQQPRPEESKRWGAVSFPPAGFSSGYVPEVPKSISVSIGTPGSSHSEGNVIKSFFLPFLPKPKLNMNARVVFGVVLDKGMGFGGAKKDAGHLPPPHRLY